MNVARDARFAIKLLLKQRGFTAAALITLALCIGANTAIFSVLNSVLLKPLPFADADRLVRIYNSYPRAGVERGGAAALDYYDRREHVAGLDAVALVEGRGMTVGESGRPERIRGQVVTPSFFDMLGVAPVLGRTFLTAESEAGEADKAVLSWGLWQERYGGSADAIGGTIRVNDVAHTIVGVMPRDFVFEDADVRVWLPLAFLPEDLRDDRRHANNWEMIARLAPGASIAQVQEQINALNASLDERLPQFRELLQQVGFRTVVVDYRSDFVREVRGTLWLLQAGVLLVLLIGCVNIANLVLVRSTARHRELATRSALGAPRSRLAGQLVTESLILALGGGLLGVLLGWSAVRAFTSFAAERLPRGTEIVLDAHTLLAAGGISMVAGLLFGGIPVLRLWRTDLSGVFREEGRSGTASRGTHRLRNGLVVAQVSLAFALLTGAGLMLVSFARTLNVDPGFEPANVVTASIALPVTRYPAAESRLFTERLLERVRSLPGVDAAGVTSVLPLGGAYNANAVTPEGYVPRPDDALSAPVNSSVSVGYFETMQMELVSGRAFTAADGPDGERVAIVDRTLANRLWPGEDPIGRRLAQGAPVPGDTLAYRTVVGVVDDVRVLGLTGEQPVGHLYMPIQQVPSAQIFLAVKAGIAPAGMVNVVRTAVTGLDPDLPAHDIRTMDERLARSVATERFRMILLVAFGSLALFLAAVGLYGVLAYSVAQRSAEIGIRMALGSSATAVFRMIMVQGVRLLGIGLVVGLVASLALGRFVRSMLYDVSPADPLVLGAVLTLLSAAVIAACLLPARRAMRVDPLSVIREQN